MWLLTVAVCYYANGDQAECAYVERPAMRGREACHEALKIVSNRVTAQVDSEGSVIYAGFIIGCTYQQVG